MRLPVAAALRPHSGRVLAVMLLGLALVLAGCAKKKATTAAPAPSVTMDFPTSVAGTATATSASTLDVRPLASSQPACHYAGADETDPLRNGYVMTRWLVGNTASWMCITDFLAQTVSTLLVAGAVPRNGSFVDLTGGGGGGTNPPTGLSVLAANGQTTLQLYFHGSTTAPGVWLTWTGSGNTYSGRLLVYTANVDNDPSVDLSVDPTSPTHMRLDFDFSASTRTASMVMAYSPPAYPVSASWNNPWLDGFRLDATEAMADHSFVIKGYMGTKAHLDSNYAPLTSDSTTKPSVQLLAVSDSAGTGAAVSNVADIVLEFTFDASNHLGYFLYTKNDRYYFTSSGGAEWIKKNVTAATYMPVNGWTNTSPSDANIDTALSLTAGTTAGCKSNTGTDCPDLLNAIFDMGVYGADLNSSSPEPNDSRQTALNAATYLTQAQPDGHNATDWVGVFDLTYP